MKKLVAIFSTVLAVVMCAVSMAACGNGGESGATFDTTKNLSVVVREDGSGTKSAFMEIIGLKGKSDISGAIVASGTAAVMTEVENNPYAIAYDSLGYVTDEVKKLKVDGVEATIENIKSGAYKISRPLNVFRETLVSVMG